MENKLGFNISYSTMQEFSECERRFYYSKIEKARPTDKVLMCYAHGGNIVHKVLEDNCKDFDFKHYDVVKTQFFQLWEKYKLSTHEKLDINGKNLNKLDYWEAVCNGLYKKYNIKNTEEQIVLNDGGFVIKGYVDATIEENGDIGIIDWKTSNASDKEQIEQLKFYGYLYYRRYNILPKFGRLEYLKINQKIEHKFKKEDLVEVKNKIEKFIRDVLSKKKFEDYEYDLSKCFFCVFKKRCSDDIKKSLKI